MRRTFVRENHKRCNEQRGLEFHHRNPYGRGADHDPSQISLMCQPHNVHLSEKAHGQEKMERYRRPRDGVREAALRYRLPLAPTPDSRSWAPFAHPRFRGAPLHASDGATSEPPLRPPDEMRLVREASTFALGCEEDWRSRPRTIGDDPRLGRRGTVNGLGWCGRACSSWRASPGPFV